MYPIQGGGTAARTVASQPIDATAEHAAMLEGPSSVATLTLEDGSRFALVVPLAIEDAALERAIASRYDGRVLYAIHNAGSLTCATRDLVGVHQFQIVLAP